MAYDVSVSDSYVKLNNKYNRLLGEFIGYLEGTLFWDIDKELYKRLEGKIKELREQE